ncbi:MAG: bifunctional phosphoglucose/phosphomannose isomerase [Tepidiformaceae bacterium]
MTRLDDPGLYALDTEGMLDRVDELGAEMLRAWRDSAEMELPPGAARATSVVVAGMGASATGGDYLAAICDVSAELPVRVVRAYTLPNYVSDRTLVVVSSYSGETEESLSCYDDAWKRGAAMLVLTTGGKLAERARADGVAVYTFVYPSSPRAALAHSLAPLLRLGSRLGLCGTDDAEVEQAAALRTAFAANHGRAVPTATNPAKQLAQELHSRIPLVFGAEHLAPVASRFKNQVAENGKALGAADALPEANHNLIVGLSTGEAAARSLSLVTLESALYDQRTQRRFEVTAQLFEGTGVPVHRLQVQGTTLLDQLLLGTAWGDYASVYLALLNGQDPTPVPQIVRLKEALAN